MGYGVALVWTLAIEVPVYTFGLVVFGRQRMTRAFAAAVGVNAASHPVAFLAVVPVLKPLVGATLAVVLIEIAIVFFEAWLLCRWRVLTNDRSVALSAISNLLSVVVGLFVLS